MNAEYWFIYTIYLYIYITYIIHIRTYTHYLVECLLMKEAWCKCTSHSQLSLKVAACWCFPAQTCHSIDPHRIFIIWAISSWFRRGPSTPDQSTPAGAPRVPSRNLFPKDTLMVCSPSLAGSMGAPRYCTTWRSRGYLHNLWMKMWITFCGWTSISSQTASKSSYGVRDCGLIKCLLSLYSVQDLHVYVSQNEIFSDFNNSDALFWSQRDLVYGDWTTGEASDGCYEHYGEMDIPEVSLGLEWAALGIEGDSQPSLSSQSVYSSVLPYIYMFLMFLALVVLSSNVFLVYIS